MQKIVTRNMIRRILKFQTYKIATFNAGEYFIAENNQQIPYLENQVQIFPKDIYEKYINEILNETSVEEQISGKDFLGTLYFMIKNNKVEDLKKVIDIQKDKEIFQKQNVNELIFFSQQCLKGFNFEGQNDMLIIVTGKKNKEKIINFVQHLQKQTNDFTKGIKIFNLINNNKQYLEDKQLSNFYFKQYFLYMDLFMIANFLDQNKTILKNNIWNNYVQNIIGLNLEQLDHITFDILIDNFIKQEYLLNSKLLLKFFLQIQNNCFELNDEQKIKTLYLLMKSNFLNNILISKLQNELQNKDQNDQNLKAMLQTSLNYFQNNDYVINQQDLEQIDNEILLYNLLSDVKYQKNESDQNICDYLIKQNIDKELILEWSAKLMYFENENYYNEKIFNQNLQKTFFELVQKSRNSFDSQEQDLLNNTSIVLWNKQVLLN